MAEEAVEGKRFMVRSCSPRWPWEQTELCYLIFKSDNTVVSNQLLVKVLRPT